MKIVSFAPEESYSLLGLGDAGLIACILACGLPFSLTEEAFDLEKDRVIGNALSKNAPILLDLQETVERGE